MSEVSFKKFDFILDIRDVVAWHEDHVKLNFPDSKYKPKLFKQKVRRACLMPFDKMWTVQVDDKKVGWVWIAKSWDVHKDIDYCELRYIHLVTEEQSLGYGAQVLKYVEAKAKKWKCKEMRLGASMNNEKAIYFYDKADYHMKRVLMEKVL